jgi:hypothetical protein
MVSKTLKDVLGRIETWPEERQEDVARILIEMEEQDSKPVTLSESQTAQVERRRAAPNRRFITLEHVRKHFSIGRA